MPNFAIFLHHKQSRRVARFRGPEGDQAFGQMEVEKLCQHSIIEGLNTRLIAISPHTVTD